MAKTGIYLKYKIFFYFANFFQQFIQNLEKIYNLFTFMLKICQTNKWEDFSLVIITKIIKIDSDNSDEKMMKILLFSKKSRKKQ